MIRRPPRSTQSRSSAASDVYKRQTLPVPVLGLVILAHVEGAGQLVLQRPVAHAAPVVHDGLDFLQVRPSVAEVFLGAVSLHYLADKDLVAAAEIEDLGQQ